MRLTVTIGDVVDVLDCQILPEKPEGLSDLTRYRRVTAVSSDSRNIHSGNLFVAIKGDSFDGHDFVASALSTGAAGALVSADWAKTNGTDFDSFSILIVVEDVLESLQDLAIWYRSRLDTEVIGITGSSGKTTTKDMTAAILSTRYNILKTPGNLNSQLGLPQVLFQLDRIHDMAVLELGMNHAGEIARLSEIARPSLGVITNVGPVHLEHLGSIEGVASAKGELLDYLGEPDTAVLNADDSYVMSQRPRTPARLVTFGRNENANVRAKEVESTFTGSVFSLEDGISSRTLACAAFQVASPQCLGRCTSRQWQPGDASDQFSGRQSARVPGQAGFFGALAQPRVSAVGKSGGVRQQMLNGDLAFRRNRLVPGGEHAWLSKLRYVS